MQQTAVRSTLGKEDFGTVLLESARFAAADVAGGFAANKVGSEYKLDNSSLNYITHKLAHGIIGAGMGAISDGEALAGFIGATVGEMVGEAYAESHPEGFNPESEDYDPELHKSLKSKGETLAQVTSALAAAFLDQNPNVAACTAQNAVTENALFLVPLVIGAVTLHEAYEVYQIYDKEGPDAAIDELIKIGVITAVTAGVGKIAFKVGAKIYPSAEAAFMAYKAQSPMLTKATEKMTGSLESAKAFMSKMKKIGKEKIGLSSGGTASSLVKKKWVIGEHNGKRVYQRDNLIDPNKVDIRTGKSNIELMKTGKAPIGPDGKKINLHHMGQQDRSNLIELTRTMHEKYSKALHINSGTGLESAINRNVFATFKKKYWKERAKDFTS